MTSASLQLIQLSILARVLSPADFGLAAMMAVALGLANAYGDMGLSNAILTHSPITRRELSSLYWIGIAFGAMLCAIVVLCAPLASNFFGQPELTALIRWGSLGFLINPIGLQFQLLFQKELEFRPIAIVDSAANIVGTTSAVLCALHGIGVLSIVIGALASSGIRAFVFIAIGAKRWPLSLQCSPSEVKGLLGFGAFQVGERTVNFCARNLDKAFIGWLLGATALGFYNTAYQLMQKPLQLVQPLATRIATPLLVHVRDDGDRIVNAYLLIINLAATCLLPAFALMLILASPLVRLVLGEQWQPVAPVLQWLACLGCFYAIGFPIGSLLIACKRADLSFWLNVWGLIPFTAAILIGSRFGLNGIAIALVLAQAFGLFTVGFWLRRKLVGMSPSRFLRTLAAPVLATMLPSAVVAIWLHTLGPVGTLQQILTGSILFALLYLAWTLAFRRNFLVKMREHFRMGIHAPEYSASGARTDEEG